MSSTTGITRSKAQVLMDGFTSNIAELRIAAASEIGDLMTFRGNSCIRLNSCIEEFMSLGCASVALQNLAVTNFHQPNDETMAIDSLLFCLLYLLIERDINRANEATSIDAKQIKFTEKLFAKPPNLLLTQMCLYLEAACEKEQLAVENQHAA